LFSGTQIAAYATYFYTQIISQKIEKLNSSLQIGLHPNHAKTLKFASAVWLQILIKCSALVSHPN
jgi:hypothetical protein